MSGFRFETEDRCVVSISPHPDPSKLLMVWRMNEFVDIAPGVSARVVSTAFTRDELAQLRELLDGAEQLLS